ncbi:hypothetical protein MUL_0702 [Mycobacterium ulcerans Agy99]|uniref:Uncharacterized protein n=4 Tax=Mycobacterium ulcerans group TaxID=2993898 RepID=A0PLY8_MYCUA|nr:hypothetical protein MUL_0702 [Mycobacterium ulcerans Agy99]
MHLLNFGAPVSAPATSGPTLAQPVRSVAAMPQLPVLTVSSRQMPAVALEPIAENVMARIVLSSAWINAEIPTGRLGVQ